MSELVVASQVGAGAACAFGGVKLQIGLDANGNATLDSSEIQSTQYVCNGANGANGTNGVNELVTTSAIAAGNVCANGGIEVDVGLDTNADGVLQSSEITSQQHICNGVNGAPGTNGIDGLTQLVKTKVLAAGSACATGGVEVDIGFDVNDDGVLQVAEIASTQDICNGANGANGSNGTNGTNGTNGKTELATVSTIAAGSVCTAGGVAVNIGFDTDGNGTLDASEVTMTQNICNGANGAAGAVGATGQPGATGAQGPSGQGCTSFGGGSSVLALLGLLGLARRRRTAV